MTEAVDTSEIIRNYAIVVGGFLGIAIAVWRGRSAGRTAKTGELQTELNRQEAVAAALRDAAELLRDQDPVKRIAAIASLEQIVRDVPEHAVGVEAVLIAHISIRGDNMDLTREEKTLIADLLADARGRDDGQR